MSQASVTLPTSGPHSASDLVLNFMNPALQALLTNAAGSTAPAQPKQWQWWLDTSTSNSTATLRLYDGAQWLAFAVINFASHTLALAGGGAGGGGSSGGGDMLQSVYDKDGNGVVDAADALGNWTSAKLDGLSQALNLVSNLQVVPLAGSGKTLTATDNGKLFVWNGAAPYPISYDSNGPTVGANFVQVSTGQIVPQDVNQNTVINDRGFTKSSGNPGALITLLVLGGGAAVMVGAGAP